MTVVVTGAAGHVGGALVRSLLAGGRRTRVLVHRNRQALEGLDVEVVSGDTRDLASLRDAFEGAELVYHAAGLISLSMRDWPSVSAVNVAGTRNVVEACLACGVRRLVHFSSFHALVQEPVDVPLDETRALVTSQAAPPYDRSKAAAEIEVRNGIAKGLDAVILSPTAIIGPYDSGTSHSGEFLLAVAQGRLPALVDGGCDWVDVRDVAAAALRAEECAVTGARYLLSGHWSSVRDLAVMVAGITGRPPPRLVSPMWLARIGAPFISAFAERNGSRPLYTSVSLQALCGNRHISHERATRDLDYAPRPLGETLADSLRWYAETGRLPHLPMSLAGEAS